MHANRLFTLFTCIACLIATAKASGVVHTVNLSGVVGGPTEEELTTMIDHFKEKLENIKRQDVDLSIVQEYEGKGFIAINGLREKPIYLYKREIKKIFEMKNEINELIDNNKLILA